ncbi:GtrA family protein [Clostridium frigoris]|uniref:GtrA family protein n=1 Tax=Clostridium frigoris TaxID=205327 RepID=A0ABS6BXZ5_9CLOT|nr:GtrA family protein [Clostridium frigoris]MBU3161473.1 GtrA family protein [Clostridium frigoris]
MIILKDIYNKYISNEKLKHIVKFGFVGGLNTTIDFGIFSVLNSIFGVNYIISQVLSYLGGTLNSYFLNKFWTFNNTKVSKKTTKEIVQFAVVNTASLGVSLIGMTILLSNNAMNPLIAKIISMVLAQVVNFLGYRFWVFGTIVKASSGTKEIA